ISAHPHDDFGAKSTLVGTLLGGLSMKRILLTICTILLAAGVCSAQTTFYYPHIANGVQPGGVTWRTTIFLTNAASSGNASGTIRFTQENLADPGLAGTPFNLSFTDENNAPAGSGNVITFSIPAGASKKYVSSGAGPYFGGFATVTTTEGEVKGTSIFSEFKGGVLVGEAGVPAVTATANQVIFVDTQAGYNVGVAFASPGAGSHVTLSRLNCAAVSVATSTQNLGTGNHIAAFTGQMFPTAGQLSGTMKIQSSGPPLAAIALRFDPTFAIFTTLPPVPLASLITHPITSIARLLRVF